MKPWFQPCETLSTEPIQTCSDFWTAALRENEWLFLLNHKICGHLLYSTLSGHIFLHISVKKVKVKSRLEHINMKVMTIIHQLLEADHGQQQILETQQLSVSGLTVGNPEFSRNIPSPLI